MATEEVGSIAEMSKYGVGTILGILLYKALDIILLLIKKKRVDDSEVHGERRISNADILLAAKNAETAATLAKDSAFDSVRASSEMMAITERLVDVAGRTHDRTNRIMDIQHELASAFKDVAHGMSKLSGIMEESRKLLQDISKDMAVAMEKINMLLNKGD